MLVVDSAHVVEAIGFMCCNLGSRTVAASHTLFRRLSRFPYSLAMVALFFILSFTKSYTVK